MQIGAENKGKVIAMVVLLVIAAGVFVYMFKDNLFGGSASAAPSVSNAVTPQAAQRAVVTPSAQDTSDPRLRLDILENSRKVKYQEGRNIFSMEAPKIEVPLNNGRPTGPPTPTPIPPPTPTPELPLKYYGFANKPGEPRKIFLQETGGEVFVVSQGDIVARRYRVVQIQANQVMMEDVITGTRQPVFLTLK